MGSLPSPSFKAIDERINLMSEYINQSSYLDCTFKLLSLGSQPFRKVDRCFFSRKFSKMVQIFTSKFQGKKSIDYSSRIFWFVPEWFAWSGVTTVLLSSSYSPPIPKIDCLFFISPKSFIYSEQVTRFHTNAQGARQTPIFGTYFLMYMNSIGGIDVNIYLSLSKLVDFFLLTIVTSNVSSSNSNTSPISLVSNASKTCNQ